MIPFLWHPFARSGLGPAVTRLALSGIVAVSLAPVAPASFAADTKGAGAPVDVMVSGQGTPVPGIKITLAPDTGGAPEAWNTSYSAPLAVIPTDSTGHARFASVPPGRYIVTTNCGLPGNWIAGNSATRLEMLPGRPARVTLTLRRGAMLRGIVLQGDRPAGHAEIRAESLDALMSTCATMTPSRVDTTSGAFVVAKIPLGATTSVKANLDFGPGQISVSKDFHIERPDTLETTLQFPALAPSDLGSLVLEFKPDSAATPNSGSAQLLQVQSDSSWRYEATIGVGGADATRVFTGLPAGSYQIRAYAEPGVNKWWSAPIDSLRIVPGKTTRYTISAKLRK